MANLILLLGFELTSGIMKKRDLIVKKYQTFYFDTFFKL